jgi:hypothetical protein
MALITGSYKRFIWGFYFKTLTDPSLQTLSLAPLFLIKRVSPYFYSKH